MKNQKPKISNLTVFLSAVSSTKLKERKNERKKERRTVYYFSQINVPLRDLRAASRRFWETPSAISSSESYSVANLATLSLDLATFQTPLATFFFFKAPSDKSSDFWKNLSNFPNVASTVLRARDLELHLSLCLL